MNVLYAIYSFIKYFFKIFHVFLEIMKNGSRYLVALTPSIFFKRRFKRCILGFKRDFILKNEPRHDKTNKMSVRSAKTQIILGIRPV